ncbi:MAG: hypothetical protein ABR552_11790 [Actinomycetota bacterium]
MKRAHIASLSAMLALLTPAFARAADPTRPTRQDITINWDGQFDRAHGIRSGRGTMMDPYVISGWTVNNINIRDTDKAIRIVNNTITGALTLNWIGHNLLVQGNDVGDLRVNENIARWGDNTAGTITRNTFASVGQLRHFDGTFSYNTVGTAQTNALGTTYPGTRGVNFDGFNGARFVNNTIYGFVDARLHGHHHSSGYGMPSHMHDMPSRETAAMHFDRYHEVFIQGNTIYTSAPYALAYLDTDHAANDRTANSETNPYLNAPHVHHTRVHIFSNRLYGAGILIDVFNAADEHHAGTRQGLVDIAGNSVSLIRDPQHPLRVVEGIEVTQARDLILKIRSNVVDGPVPLTGIAQIDGALTNGDGILLDILDRATVSIEGDRVSDRQFGVRALQLTKSVRWSVRGLVVSGVSQAVSYDNTNKPQ